VGGALPKHGRHGDQAASLEILNREFRPSLTRFFVRRVPESDIEDMVQDVLLRLSKRGNLEEIERLGGYVFQTARSVMRDHLRKWRSQERDSHCSFDEEFHGDADFSPERVLLARERVTQAKAALLELPERTRAIFILRRIEKIKYEDIAARLDISVSAVEKHMLRAVRHLATRLEEQ
jgi:RNA polymerase sigma-70 factor (ECF subfamily)